MTELEYATAKYEQALNQYGNPRAALVAWCGEVGAQDRIDAAGDDEDHALREVCLAMAHVNRSQLARG